MSGYMCCLVVVFFLVGKVAGRAFTTNTTSISNGTFIGVEALDAVTLTTISWTLQGRIVVYFDRLATDVLRFASAENETLNGYVLRRSLLRSST